ncbi:efflux RND transporter periplasmic adaptor subunit [Ideonella sp. YS5]|uniref:efflux RND transporter periplasmic adaptor subunit n=1 Tax=Ideonella sp. YS5 TaxID=3453714 RepID=UPI003EE87175
MQRKTWILLGAGAAGAIALFAWAFAPRPLNVETATVSQGHFETSIEEDGKTRLRDRYVVSAPLAGRLSRPSLREGDEVQADAVVAQLNPVLAPMQDDRTLREQQARVEMALAQVRSAAAHAEAARLAWEQSRNDLTRNERLALEGFVSPTKLDNDRLGTLAAQKELDAAQAQRRVAEHEVEQARAALSAVRSPGGAGARVFEVRSPVAGRVLRVTQGSEATVGIGAPLLELGDTRRLEVVAELLTTDALQALPGNRVAIERWGGAGVLEGRVRLVEPAAFTKVSALGVEEQRVEVLIDLTSPPEHWQALGDGYRVGVRIITAAVDQAVKVPLGAVFPRPDGQGGGMAVFALRGGRAALVPVTLAARNGSEAWVQQGLKPGDEVIVYPSAAVRDGTRVRRRTV